MRPEAAAEAPSILLVHGAFADGAGWRPVYDDLIARGYRVSIVQNPLTSLADDVVIVSKGSIVWQGSAAAIRADTEAQHRWLGV